MELPCVTLLIIYYLYLPMHVFGSNNGLINLSS